MAIADNIPKDNNGLKFIQLRQDFFDRIVHLKGLKIKGSKIFLQPFQPRLKETIEGREFESENLQKSEDTSTYFAIPKAYKSTRHWVRLKIFKRLKTTIDDYYLPLHGRLKIQIKLKKMFLSSKLRNPEGNTSCTWQQKTSRTPVFCPHLTANHYKKMQNPKFNLETEFPSPSVIHLPWRVASVSSHEDLRRFSFVSKKATANTVKGEPKVEKRVDLNQGEFIKVV